MKISKSTEVVQPIVNITTFHVDRLMYLFCERQLVMPKELYWAAVDFRQHQNYANQERLRAELERFVDCHNSTHRAIEALYEEVR